MRILLLIILMCGAGAASAAAPVALHPYPGESVYQLKVALRDQTGAPATLDRYAGAPTLVTMFYASCKHVCPMLIAAVQRFESSLPADQRARLRVLLVSLDPQDGPQAFATVVARHKLDTMRWSLMSASAADVRLVAAALGIRYRQLPGGEFSHSTIITLLDADGRPLRRTERFSDPEPEFRAAVVAALQPAG